MSNFCKIGFESYSLDEFSGYEVEYNDLISLFFTTTESLNVKVSAELEKKDFQKSVFNFLNKNNFYI
jgi:hypothetical protein